jgi:pimeloyl-ACP methyl ester carboxylesterase
VSSLEKVSLGGTEQWVLHRSEDVANPVVLFLHGGPGTSQLTANRRNTRSLERSFVVVTWDQRGAGKSYRAIHDTRRMTIAQFVDDTVDLTRMLLDRYGQEKLVLVGHSWGSVIGAMAAAAHPELYHCYVGIGQVAHMREGEALSYRWVLQQARDRGDARAVQALVAMGPPPYRGDWQRATIRQRALLARFGGETQGSRTGAMTHVLGALLVSREYSYRDRVNYFRGIFGSMRLLWPELMEVDLFESVPEIAVPVVFAEGRYDMESPSEIAARYFSALRAPSKQLVWFENSGHLPNTEERAAFNRMMIDTVLPLTRGA